MTRLVKVRTWSGLFSRPSTGIRWILKCDDVFFGTWNELICTLQAESLTSKDRGAICMVVDAFLQHKDAFQATFGPSAILLPSLLFLYCWTPRFSSAETDIVLALIEIDMFKALNELGYIGQEGLESIGQEGLESIGQEGLESIGQAGLENLGLESIRWLWSNCNVNNAAPVLSLLASVIRASFESRNVDSTSHPEEERWLDYLLLPENSASIVSIFTFQGTSRTPASVAQVRGDLSLLFDSQSQWDNDTLQECRAALEDKLLNLVPRAFWDNYGPNMKEARRVIDKLIAQQSPKLTNMLSRLLRRSRKSVDAEAR
ncbi:hypothetical protein CPB85DRAFT_296154 [Mucidula mucida]|nr:hypothetical protein CPB85DRAFT_296154 [Mucidula mucida]